MAAIAFQSERNPVIILHQRPGLWGHLVTEVFQKGKHWQVLITLDT